jgi:hypothetical protein
MPHVIFPPQRTPDGTVTAITDTGMLLSVELGW